MIPNIVTVKYIDPFKDLDEKNAENYYRSGQRLVLMKKLVINPFEKALKDGTDYSDENIPKKKEITEYKLDDISFRVSSTPSPKRPAVKDVHEYLKFYLKEIENEYQEGVRRRGVVTIDNRPYISVNLVLKKISDKKQEIVEMGVKQEIEDPVIPKKFIDKIDEDLPIPVTRDFSEITKDNGIVYVNAEKRAKYFSKNISSFEKELKERTGWTVKKRPEETMENFNCLGKHLFKIQTVPTEPVNYNRIITSLAGSKTKTGKIGKATGDLVRILNETEDPRTKKYNIKTRENERFISLESLKNRIEELEEEATEKKIRQTIEHYPLV